MLPSFSLRPALPVSFVSGRHGCRPAHRSGWGWPRARRGHEPVAATCPEDDKRTHKFEDPTLHLRFSFSSRCRQSMAAASAHLRVQLKNVAKQSAVDPAAAIFTESALILSWKRPVATKAAHAWFYRALTGVNWKDGDGTWLVLPYLGGDVPSSVVELASGSLRAAANRAATSLAPITAATSLTSVFPTSPALKLLRGGDKSLQTVSRYVLYAELGSGTFGTVFAAKIGNESVAIKRFNADSLGQCKIDAAEVAVSGMGCCRLSQTEGCYGMPSVAGVCLLVVSLSGVWVWSGCAGAFPPGRCLVFKTRSLVSVLC